MVGGSAVVEEVGGVFVINLPLQFLYRGVGTSNDCDPLFMGVDGNSKLCGVRFFCWSRQADVMTLGLFWERFVFC